MPSVTCSVPSSSTLLLSWRRTTTGRPSSRAISIRGSLLLNSQGRRAAARLTAAGEGRGWPDRYYWYHKRRYYHVHQFRTLADLYVLYLSGSSSITSAASVSSSSSTAVSHGEDQLCVLPSSFARNPRRLCEALPAFWSSLKCISN